MEPLYWLIATGLGMLVVVLLMIESARRQYIEQEIARDEFEQDLRNGTRNYRKLRNKE